ncbi:MAG TPA: LppP/LprE family lipoprotein, partial [Solirubrobacteraceae bacterium]|nr:LppP/LprE family lipoprotein [Solirubrobacteraceae bacterium]
AAPPTTSATGATGSTANTTTSPPPASTPQTTTAPAGGTPAPSTPTSTTRTAPEPAFAQHATGTAAGEAGGAEVAAAVGAVKSQGYTPNDTAEYHPHQTLQVLLGTRDDSTAGYNERAFFFLDGKYIGTDASQPSASMRVLAQSDTEVVIAYALYRPRDPLCCPGGGQATVHFQLNDGQLTPLQPIPPASSTTGLSRQ